MQVTPAMFATAVGEHVEIDIGGLGLFSYAMSCFVRGEWVPHLVVQGEHGPVMLLLLLAVTLWFGVLELVLLFQIFPLDFSLVIKIGLRVSVFVKLFQKNGD